jgi:acetyltransferase-like isoleucine patch superfamily enzyme
MILKIYKRWYYKYLDVCRRLNFLFRRLRYLLHPDIKLGKNVLLGKNASLEILYGGSIRIGDNTEILDGCKILTYGGEIVIGNKCSINPYTVIYGHGGTTIGDDVLIAGQCMIIPANHKFGDVKTKISKQGMHANGIVIKNNVWIGQGASILDNVVLEEGAVVAAGSVVNKSISKYSLVGGVPAKLIRKYD